MKMRRALRWLITVNFRHPMLCALFILIVEQLRSSIMYVKRHLYVVWCDFLPDLGKNVHYKGKVRRNVIGTMSPYPLFQTY